ncbi:MAG: hypothetical protein QOD00_1287 [Blastocatellia bacterium]|nr:hypothetical protein [Blastocatellia bacterium]
MFMQALVQELTKKRLKLLKLLVLLLFVAGFLVFIFTDNRGSSIAQAYSAGPPAGHTGAPGEFTCAECHTAQVVGNGRFTITAPQSYVPGQTYQITVNHVNSDPTRLRWGFELTALADDQTQAGNLQSADNLTQILDNQGPGSARQYIEHTAPGTFAGQQGGASWTFNWTAPSTDVGNVTFYAAGNQANNDGNTTGDYIFTTFVAATPATAAPDFSLTATPASQFVTQGNSVTYNLTLSPSGGFTGQINLSVSGLPTGASASFNPSSVTLDDASSKPATLTVTTSGSTPVGTYQLNINAASGSLQHSFPVSLKVQSTANADLSVSQSASPNPATAGMGLGYRIVVSNNGPANATNVILTEMMSPSMTLTAPGICSVTGPTLTCNLGSLGAGTSIVINIALNPTTAGTITNTVSVSSDETDPDLSNNSASLTTTVEAQSPAPSMTDPALSVRTVVSGLNSPTSMAFLGPDDFLVLEKSTGKVQRVTNGAVQSAVLDLAVNNASERGLLGIALHPNFAVNHFVYLYWTESSTGTDSGNLADVPLLGNRVDRYIWNGSQLIFDLNLIKLRAYQADANQPLRGNHNGGVIRFGPDGKLYIIIGDNGRRGLLQNITSGGPVPDDQYGGPEPDDAHLTGVILRLNDDGTTPSDNPFFNVNSGLTGQAAANVRKIYAYGVRNSFGMAFDPFSANLWTEENGDDSFDEINRVSAGFNGGWTQVIGPVNRIAQYKAIESSYGAGNLQQLRWSPSLIADTPADALARLYNLPGSHYTDPEFSWKYAVAPAPIGFVKGRGLGPQYEGDMFVGASRTALAGGYLFRFKPGGSNRQHLILNDARLSDLVADNADKFDITESESLLAGRDFGITTDIETGPNGNLFIVSNTNNAVYEIYATPPTLYVATLTGAQVVPPTNSNATGTATLLLSPDGRSARISLNFSGLSSGETAAHIHGPADVGQNSNQVYALPFGQFSDYQINFPGPTPNPELLYIDLHSNAFPGGEIRGQFKSVATASSLQFDASSYSVSENGGSAVITVNRYGDTSGVVTVDYATSDGTATGRTDYITSSGTLYFAAGETSKSFNVLIEDDAYPESSETINLALSNPTGGAFLGSPNTSILFINDNDTTTPASNPLDDAKFFVRQQYLDFLNREPDAGGLDYWTNEITRCGADTACINSRRIGVSAAFFIETEFQESGYFVYRLYKSGLGRQPTFAEFTIDRSRVVGGSNLEASKTAFVNEFITRAEFLAQFPQSMTPEQYVDKLNANTGNALTQAQRDALVNGLKGTSPTETRATVLRKVADNSVFKGREFNPAFVLMQYFGYLRREPETGGYLFWLDVLNNREPGNFRGMVCSFITSAEYQQRFGSVVTRTNRDCAGVK